MATPEGFLLKATHDISLHDTGPSGTISSNCPPSCVGQYEKLKQFLNEEQFRSIIKCTQHGIQRLIERGFEPTEIASLVKNPDFYRTQQNGAKVFIKKINDTYNILIINEINQEVVTAIKNTTLKKIMNLGKRYGWTL